MKKLLIIGAGLLAFLMLLGGCVALVAGSLVVGASDVSRTFDEAQYDTVAEWPGATGFSEQFELEWPSSSRQIKVASDGFQDPIYQFRLTIDPADLDSFVASPGCSGLLEPENSQPLEGVIVEQLDWWKPESATSFQRCDVSDTPGRTQQVMIDRTDSDQYVVYVAVYYW